MSETPCAYPTDRDGSDRPHRQKEAFCLMKYRAIDGSETEWIWNSRDGVTPFCISSRSGVEMRHVEWRLDRYFPLHVPEIGDRIFVDLTPARAVHIARARVEHYWDHANYPLSGAGRWQTKEEAVAEFAQTLLAQPGEPDLIEVDAAWLIANMSEASRQSYGRRLQRQAIRPAVTGAITEADGMTRPGRASQPPAGPRGKGHDDDCQDTPKQ